MKKTKPSDGTPYWYITDKLEVIATIYQEGVLVNSDDDERVGCGNYYNSQKSAMKDLKAIKKIVRQGAK